jgi:cell division protein FtsB
LLCVVGYFAVFGANGLMDYRQKRRESRELDRQIKALQEQNGGMEQEIKALKDDPQTIEKEARERLRYARPGEVVYTVSPPAVASSPEKK